MQNINFKTYIKAVGTGPKANRELTEDEMSECMRQILQQTPSPEQIAAFLLGWRVRAETVDELKCAYRVFDEYMQREDIKESVELGYAYDGKSNYPYLFHLIGSYLKPFNLSIVISGDEAQPAKEGVTVKDIATNIALDGNIHYFDRKKYFNHLSLLTHIRNELGLRTAFNTLEKLLNPANSKFAVTSAFHKPYVEKYNRLFGKHYENLIIVKGSEGAPEFFSNSKYWTYENFKPVEHLIDVNYFDANYPKSTKPLMLEDHLECIRNPSPKLQNIAKLNAALLLVAAKKADNIKLGYEMLN